MKTTINNINFNYPFKIEVHKYRFKEVCDLLYEYDRNFFLNSTFRVYNVATALYNIYFKYYPTDNRFKRVFNIIQQVIICRDHSKKYITQDFITKEEMIL